MKMSFYFCWFITDLRIYDSNIFLFSMWNQPSDLFQNLNINLLLRKLCLVFMWYRFVIILIFIHISISCSHISVEAVKSFPFFWETWNNWDVPAFLLIVGWKWLDIFSMGTSSIWKSAVTSLRVGIWTLLFMPYKFQAMIFMMENTT